MEHYPFFARPLPYPDGALEPHLSETIISRHVSEHFQPYVDRLNATLETYPLYHQWPLERLLTSVPLLPAAIQDSVKRNGGGVYNHKLYFYGMAPAKEYRPPRGALMQAIEKSFGSLENFQIQFLSVTSNLYGEGYTWLTADPYERGGVPLRLINSAGQDTPLARGVVPLLAVDLWRHAYELDYGMRREEYVQNWFSLIRWAVAEERYRQAMNLPPEEGEADTAPPQTVAEDLSSDAAPVAAPQEDLAAETAISHDDPAMEQIQETGALQPNALGFDPMTEDSNAATEAVGEAGDMAQVDSSLETAAVTTPLEQLDAAPQEVRSTAFFDPILEEDLSLSTQEESPVSQAETVRSTVPTWEEYTVLGSQKQGEPAPTPQGISFWEDLDAASTAVEQEQIPYLLRNEDLSFLPDPGPVGRREQVPTLLREEGDVSVPTSTPIQEDTPQRRHTGRNPAAWSQRAYSAASQEEPLPGIRPRKDASRPFFRGGSKAME